MVSTDIRIQITVIMEAWLRSMHGVSMALYRLQYGWRRFFLLDWWKLALSHPALKKKGGL